MGSGAGLFGYCLHEHHPVSTLDLLVANPDERRFGGFPVGKVLFTCPAAGTLKTPFPDQGPAINQILLQLEMIITGWRIISRRDLHVDAHTGVDREVIRPD